jgi:hypothetical protein
MQSTIPRRGAGTESGKPLKKKEIGFVIRSRDGTRGAAACSRE